MTNKRNVNLNLNENFVKTLVKNVTYGHGIMTKRYKPHHFLWQGHKNGCSEYLYVNVFLTFTTPWVNSDDNLMTFFFLMFPRR